MKFLNINATISVKPQFDGEVLKAGTPLDISGAIANSDAAVGLVANDTAKGAESIAIVTEGTIDLTEIAASYGSALTDECIAALKGITFLYGGKAVVPSGGGGGFVVNATQDENDSDVWTFDHTPAEVEAALAAGTPAIMLVHWAGGLRVDTATQIGESTNLTFAVLLSQDSGNRFRAYEYSETAWNIDSAWQPMLPLIAGADEDTDDWSGVVNAGDGRMYIQPINEIVPFDNALEPYRSAIWASMVDGKTCVAMPATGDLLGVAAAIIIEASDKAHHGRGTMLTNVFGLNDTYQVVNTTDNAESGQGFKTMYAIGTFPSSTNVAAKITTVELHFEVYYSSYEVQYGWIIVRMTEESATIMS